MELMQKGVCPNCKSADFKRKNNSSFICGSCGKIFELKEALN